jgi:hypothetical protein
LLRLKNTNSRKRNIFNSFRRGFINIVREANKRKTKKNFLRNLCYCSSEIIENKQKNVSFLEVTGEFIKYLHLAF